MSRTSPGRRRRASSRRDATPWAGPSREGGALRARGAGFTLAEVMLTIGLLVLVAGIGALSFANWYAAERLPGAAKRVESMLRLARAEAAARGKRVRLEFGPGAGDASPRPAFTWEPEPLAEPGQYVPFTAAAWTADLAENLVSFARCERTGESALTLSANDREGAVSRDGRPLQAVTFQPDGTCDSAVIELVSRDESDHRTAVITLDAATGEVAVQVLTQSEMNALESTK